MPNTSAEYKILVQKWSFQQPLQLVYSLSTLEPDCNSDYQN